MRTFSPVPLLVATALVASACASAGAQSTAEASLRSAAFTPAGVRACLRKARTSLGVVVVDRDPEAARRLRARTVLSFWLLQSDVGRPGVTIAFASSAADTVRLQRTAYARTWARQGPGFVRSLVFRRRSNVVYWYQRQTMRETVRIAAGCLGGPPYRGNGGTAPDPGPPTPPG